MAQTARRHPYSEGVIPNPAAGCGLQLEPAQETARTGSPAHAVFARAGVGTAVRDLRVPASVYYINNDVVRMRHAQKQSIIRIAAAHKRIRHDRPDT